MARQTQAVRRWAQDLRSGEAGQAVVMSVVWMVVVLGMAGLTIDVGSWYRSQRHLQAQADASALAGAQELPKDTSRAESVAQTYATKNGLSLPVSDIAISQDRVPNDSITVNADADAPTFFTKLFGLDSVGVGAKATARNSLLGEAQFVAPITVNILHPMLTGKDSAGNDCPCFDEPTTLTLSKRWKPGDSLSTGAGAFGLLDLSGVSGNGSSTLGDWIQNGYDGYLAVNKNYSSNTGANFNSTSITNALGLRKGTVLLFPVYDSLTAQGTIAWYHIVAWVAFRLDDFAISGGNSGTLYGEFTSITWQGVPAPSSNGGEPDFGAHIVTLTH